MVERKRLETRGSVLIVEDNSETREALARFFRAEGYKAYVAVDQGTAEDILYREPVGVLVCDLRSISNLPLVVSLARQLNPGMVALTLSAYSLEKQRQLVGRDTFDMHFVKPVSCREILEAVESKKN